MTSSLVLGEALVVFALLVIVAVRWRWALVMSLPFLAIFNGLAIPFAGSSMRVDQLVACALVVPLAASIMIGADCARIIPCGGSRRFGDERGGERCIRGTLVQLAQCVNLASVWIIYPLLLASRHTDSWRCSCAGCSGRLSPGAASPLAYVLAVSGMSVGGAE
jgi:hypothetical protein